MKTIAIIHGWAGGPQITKYFTQALQKDGFEVIEDHSKANIIFAHSAGCYKLPNQIKAQLIVFQGPPYWPGRNIFSRITSHSVHDTAQTARVFGLGYLVSRRLWETYYVLRHPSVTFVAIRNNKKLDFLAGHPDSKKLVVRNRDDKLCSPEIKRRVQDYQNVKYAELPGLHDDYIRHPGPYVELIKENL